MVYRICVLSIILTATPAFSQNRSPRPMSLEDCITVSLRHNFKVQIARYDPRVAGFTLAAAYGVYDPEFTFKGVHEYEKSPGGFDDEGRPFGGPESDTDSFASGINGLLPWGLTYDLSGRASDETGTTADTVSGVPVRVPFQDADARVGFLQLRQPLLKNFWIDAPRLEIFVRKQGLQISELELRQQMMATVTDVQSAYYHYSFARDNVTVQQRAVELAERLVAENKRRVEVGALAPLDETQSESQAATSRADLQSAEAQRDTAERLLKNLLSDNYTNNRVPWRADDRFNYPNNAATEDPTNAWADVEILPTEKLLAIPQQFDLHDSWRAGMAKRPDLLVARKNLETEERRIRYRHNQLFPQVDAIGTVGYSGSGNSYGDAFDQISRRDNSFYTVGGQLTVPLSRTAERNAYRAVKATREQVELGIRQLEQAILVEIEDGIASVRTTLANVAARHQARLYAEAALKAEEKKLETGKSTSFFVLQLQRDLTSARSTEIRALADYNIALARLAFADGTTLERNRIQIDSTSGNAWQERKKGK